MRRSADFSLAVRKGRRVRRGVLVVHQHRAHQAPLAVRPAVVPDGSVAGRLPQDAPLVGFVVGRAVGNSVVRHRVVRRLRAVTATRLPQLPAGSRTVVRALPAAASASSAGLTADLDQALGKLDRAFAASSTTGTLRAGTLR